MKKFLIFLVSIIVVVCIGSVTYAFLRNDEVITIATKEIYCNAGDTISLKDLGISVRKKSRKTTYDYNAGGEEVTNKIEFDSDNDVYVVKSNAAGDVNLKITTSNKKFAEFIVSVHVGNGSEENPYFVFGESTLSSIGSVYGIDKNYILMSDIILTEKFAPIGSAASETFAGSFNGNGHKISNLKLSGNSYASAGLFYALSSTSKVSNLVLDKAEINGSYEFAGVLAGKIAGTIDRIAITNSKITNTSENAKVGAVAGLISGKAELAYVDNCEISTIAGATNSKIFVGGFAGEVSGKLNAVYANNVKISVQGDQTNALCAGLVGNFIIGVETGEILQSYANASSEYANYAAFIGRVSYVDGFDFKDSKATFLRHLVGNVAISKDNAVDTDIVKEFNLEVNSSTDADIKFFRNVQNSENSVFFDKTAGQYLISYFANTDEVKTLGAKAFVFYALNAAKVTPWDFEYIWQLEGALPTLRFTVVNPTTYTNEYLLKDVSEKTIDEEEVTFKSEFNKDPIENIKDVKYVLESDVDLTIYKDKESWIPVALENCVIDGNGKTITINIANKKWPLSGKTFASGLFTSLKSTTIKNLTIKVVGLSADGAGFVGALAAEIVDGDQPSNIDNVNVIYDCSFPTLSYEVFGGLVAVAGSSTINNCSVTGLDMASSSNVQTAGGLVGTTSSLTSITKSSCNANVYATKVSGGFIAINEGAVSGLTGKVNVYSKGSADHVGGVVGLNTGSVLNSNVEVSVNASTADDVTVNVGGVASTNAGTLQGVVITGSSISSSAKSAYIGGIVGYNSATGSISNCKNYVSTIGQIVSSANQYVGGIAGSNGGRINKCITSSDINGNYVAGVVASMTSSAAANISEVVVAKYNDGVLSANKISGDKYVAGIVVDLQFGNISDVQAISEINGNSDSTRSSLVALVFTYGTSIKNSTIDSSIIGNGTKYREVWTDFASYSNKAEFGLGEWRGDAADGRFNLYVADAQHGSMQSVVINGSNAGVSDAKASMGEAWAWVKDYNDTDESSFVKVTNNFNNNSEFQGSYEFVCSVSSWFNIEHKVTKTLTFDLNSIWKTSESGISLRFLAE